MPEPLTANSGDKVRFRTTTTTSMASRTLRLIVQEGRCSLLQLRVLERLVCHALLNGRLVLVEHIALVWRTGSQNAGSTQQRAEKGELHVAQKG